MSENWRSFYVNVSYEGNHYCRIEIPDNLTEEEARERARTLRTMFTRFSGMYSVTLYRVIRSGQQMEL